MLESLLTPRGVAVIGASQDATKLGYSAARNLVVSGYRGAIHLVNPRGGELFGLPMHPDPEAVPDPVDLAIILVPAPIVPGVLKACGRRGIRAAIIGAGGFREKGEEGAQLEAECLEIAQRHHIRVLGPNSIGFLDMHLPIDTSFLPLPGPIAGDITFLSHSGAICEAVIDWARGQGFGLARLISLGNQMDLTETEMLSACVEDEETRVVAMYLEGVCDGRAFVDQAARAVQSKPVIAIKVGRSKEGSRAVASHTGAMAGEDEAYSAAFRRAGVLRAATSEEMFDWARALAWCPLPAGRRVAVLTNAGGPGAIAIDAIEDCGLRIAVLAEGTKEALRELLPREAAIDNPVDMLASAGPRQYARSLHLLLEDEGVDSIMVILPPPPVSTAADIAGAMLPQIKASDKPIVIALMGEELIAHAAQLLRQSRVPDYRFPERAASALRALVERAEQMQRPPFEPPGYPDLQPTTAKEALAASKIGAAEFVDVETASAVVASYGVKLPEQAVVRSEEAAVAAAQRMGGPVALKLATVDLVHKSDVGGVVLGIDSPDDIRRIFSELQRKAEGAGVPSEGAQVLIQEMAPAGRDVIVGSRRDPQFGPLVVFGAGGIEVEMRRDVSFRLAPLDAREAEAMIDDTVTGRMLAGGRGQPALDREATIDILLRFSRMANDLADEVAEAEINPLRVLPHGVLALDVRLRRTTAGEKSGPD